MNCLPMFLSSFAITLGPETKPTPVDDRSSIHTSTQVEAMSTAATTELDNLIWVAGLLGSPTRLIVWHTVGPLGMYPSDLASTLELSLPTVSFHLARLHEAGLVQVEREGRHRLYKWTDLRLAIVPETDLQVLRGLHENSTP